MFEKIKGVGKSRMNVLYMAYVQGEVTHEDTNLIPLLMQKNLLKYAGGDKYVLTDFGEQYYTVQIGDRIEDGFGSVWNSTCDKCGKKSMQVVRPGKAQCAICG